MTRDEFCALQPSQHLTHVDGRTARVIGRDDETITLEWSTSKISRVWFHNENSAIYRHLTLWTPPTCSNGTTPVPDMPITFEELHEWSAKLGELGTELFAIGSGESEKFETGYKARVACQLCEDISADLVKLRAMLQSLEHDAVLTV